MSRKLIRHVGSVSLATLVSRLLGYVRDALVAYAFGGGPLTDAFYAAFRLPNLFRRLLGEGSLTAAFVPVFSEHVARDTKDDARNSFQTIFTLLFVLLGVIVTAGVIYAPEFTHLVAWGFKSDPEKFELTVKLTRLMFPFLLFVCLAALSAGALNSLGYFFVPSLAPAMLSVAEIGFVLWLSKRWEDPLEGLAVSAVIGGALHFGLLVPLLYRSGVPPAWKWNPSHPDVKKVGTAVLPAMWGLSLDQVNAFFDTICASFLATGAVTALYNSNRLMQFPLALFGIAMSTAALPALSASAARQDWEQVKETLNFSLRIVFFSVIPAMVGLVVLGIPVIELLFEHGRFTHTDTLLTNGPLAMYCLGLPAYAGVKVLASCFYAMKDTKTPVKVATACLFINMIGNVAFMFRWGVAGLAFATTLASSANALLLFWLLRKRLGLIGGRRLFRTLMRSLFASALMAAAAAAVVQAALPLAVRVPLAVLAGAIVYLAAAKALNMEELRHVENLLGRRELPSTEKR